MTKFRVWIRPTNKAQRKRIEANRVGQAYARKTFGFKDGMRFDAHRFGRKKYYLHAQFKSKKDALAQARKSRRSGWNAIVTVRKSRR